MLRVGSARQDTLKSLDRLPKFSPMMAQLLARFTHRNCDARTLAEVVSKDALLSGQVLRLANSATLSRQLPIHSVKHAIALIGVGAMRRFALGTSLTNLFSRRKMAPNFSVTRFNLHSVATATLVEVLADVLPVHNAENAFISGLLHDVGKMLIAVTLQHEYEDILSMSSISNMPLIECEEHILGTNHAELSSLAIANWNLPEPIQWAAAFHHDPDGVRDREGGPDKVNLTLVVHRANAFINYMGMSVLPRVTQPAEAPSLEFEGFPYDRDRTLDRFVLEWKSLGDLFR